MAIEINRAEILRRANDSVGVDIDAKLKSWQQALDRVEDALRTPNVSYSQLNMLRDRLLALRAETEAFGQKLQGPLSTIDERVEKLPSLPAQGQPPETEQVSRLRAELTYHLGILTSARDSLNTTRLRIDQLINQIQDVRRSNFTKRLFQPVPGIYSKQTWETVPEFARLARDRVVSAVATWWQNVQDKQEHIFLGEAAAALWLILSLLGWRGVKHLRVWRGAEEPAFWRRASSAAGVILLRCLPTVIAIVFLYNAIEQVQPMPANFGWLAYSAGRVIIIIVVVIALVATVLAPGRPRWRLIPASDGAAYRISMLVLALALLYGATTFVYQATRVVQAPFSLTLALTLPANLIEAVLVFTILGTAMHEKQMGGMPSLFWLRALRFPVLLIALAIVVTALSGYLALSNFIAQQLIVTGSILALAYLFLLWADGFAQALGDDNSALGSQLRSSLDLEASQRQRIAVPAALVLKFAVLVASVPLILQQWGYPWGDIFELYHQFFFGFHIGNSQTTVAAILAAIIVFILGYFAAKLFQSWLDTQVLKPAGLSGGLRDSIRTGVGYIGVFAAALIALSSAGFPLSNLALVAGAFSVGIGFGLQSVVSNFVSGLILLAERPIKVGDLVVVGGEEGYVRKISVRSTEIETADRANVLIPNSFFITEKVKNCTLRNNSGRVTVSVGVAYGCDPRKVKAILLKAAQDNLNVMTTPEPFVDFEEFGRDALNFKLYAFIYDLTKSVSTRTDLRIAILDAFNAEGIVIPSQQTEVTLRDMDWLREAVNRYITNPHETSTKGKRDISAFAEPAE